MLQKTFVRLKSLSTTTRTMIFLFLIYEFAQIITEIFLNTFIFLQTKSVILLVIYNSVYFTGCMIGFVVWGFIMAQLRISLKYNYLRAFIIFFISFVVLLVFPHDFPYLLIFAILNGIGLGMFWVGVHSYEITQTNNSDRDFYSSMLEAGKQIFLIIAPFVATLSFILSERVFHTETFKILFWILPLIYIFALPFLFKLPDLVPEKIELKEVKRLLFDNSISKARHYYLIGAFDWALLIIVLPVLSITAMKTVINIGVLETIMGVISFFIITFLSHIRHKDNRIKIMLYGVIGIVIGYSFLFMSPIFPYTYIVYSLCMVVVRPVFRVSEHTIDLYSVELIKGKQKCFFPSLLYRDFMLWISRIISMILIIFIAYMFNNDLVAVQFGVLLLAIFKIIFWFIAKRLVESR